MSHRTCAIDGCDIHITARGWCSKHYMRYKRYGDANYRIGGEIRDGRRICPPCGEDVPLSGYSPSNNFCRACMAAKKRDKHVPVVTVLPNILCSECRQSFSPRKKSVICCSAPCSLVRKNRLDREMERDAEKANASTRRWYLANRETSFQGAHRYRARKLAAFVEDVDRVIVFERDGWVCQICNLPVDRSAPPRSHESPSVDHRIPLSAGGLHAYENCQTAHLICNVRKGARLIA